MPERVVAVLGRGQVPADTPIILTVIQQNNGRG